MEPTLVTGDLILAQKRGFARDIGRGGLARGELVLFTPPAALKQRVQDAGGRMGDRDMFVKRVAAVAGDEVTVDALGDVTVNGLPVNRLPAGRSPSLRLAAGCDAPNEVARKSMLVPGTSQIPEGSIFVLGDCSGASVDSRVWGPLNELNVVGTPTARLWPASRFGGVR
jgi:signal peptidase I